jgi:hypothetical protein
MSLPWVLGTTEATIPDRVPYLSAPLPKAVAADAAAGRLKIGLSLPSGADAAALFDVPAIQIVPLQANLDDIADLATTVTQMDLVISGDSPVVHLAGALAKPAWVMLAYAPDWRWGLGRSDSPWYPSLRLFRQASVGGWEGVVRDVAQALVDFRPS